MESSLRITFDNNALLPLLYGVQNRNISIIEALLRVSIATRGNTVVISGASENVSLAAGLLEALHHRLSIGSSNIAEFDIHALLGSMTADTGKIKISDVLGEELVIKTKLKQIFPYNEHQRQYLRSLIEKDIIFGIGAAGTGKTYLAVAMAVQMFLEKKVNKVILTRPVVEAGERLGFLPGDIKEKVDPYLQPLYDALYEMIPSESIERYFVTKELQLAPLAFMRGRTLSNAFVILDEAQNVTVSQMKMFLTRLGYGSKMAITGDLTQIDLPRNVPSGLQDAVKRLQNIKEIAVMTFETQDVVRHRLTKKIIDAYEKSM